MAVEVGGLPGKVDSFDETLASLSTATAARFEMICMRDLLGVNPDARVASKD